MTLRLVQFRAGDGSRGVAAAFEDDARRVDGVTTTYELALAALDGGVTLEAAVKQRLSAERVDLRRALDEQRILAPIDHPDSAHLHLTGTGLTHLGSAESRDKMHQAAASGPTTDSMRMFLMGMEGGKPAEGKIGVQPEWFYKGDGASIVAPGAPLPSPDFALDGGEEPEIACLYVIAPDGTPCRLGFALGNEFSDHVMERQNYLYLAHSKLRPCAIGPEILVGEPPASIQG
ncbi:MAG: AraD1 family protein, partial [Steroidobacteraceae bacterium]